MGAWLAMVAIWMVPEGKQDSDDEEDKNQPKVVIQDEPVKTANFPYLIVLALMMVQLSVKVCWDFKDSTCPQWLSANYPETYDFTMPSPSNNNTEEKYQASKGAFSDIMMYGGFCAVFVNLMIAYIMNPSMYGGEPSEKSCIMRLNRGIQGKDHFIAMFGVALMGFSSFFAMCQTQVWITWAMCLLFSCGLSFALVFISSIAAKAAKGAQGTILSIVDMAKNGASIFSPKLAQSLWIGGHGFMLKYISAGCAGCAVFFILVILWV